MNAYSKGQEVWIKGVAYNYQRTDVRGTIVGRYNPQYEHDLWRVRVQGERDFRVVSGSMIQAVDVARFLLAKSNSAT